MSLILRIFCRHKWHTHSKKDYEQETTRAVPGTENWFAPKWEQIRNSETVEILTCKECGKVKKVVY